ncbi:NUDIX hydrolase [Nocardia farcinica]|nr:NUDIX hydrolase [Nocardia farcinica]MBF6281401.1 NUDIX hydrolase [Nocardia farcinica]MBF6305803.1 NUDIX hydrolase [Nocardia farcinica]MBF6389968.1 NUDIX hydrolase [Nocardia farcinica]MBF6491352.1 NUDIX hydrolase [Nocardia farcinica]
MRRDQKKEVVVEDLASARLAAGALFRDGERVLLVHKVYGDGWDLPGGYVEPGESPAAACRREVREELGIVREVRRLLVHDWAPMTGEGDKVLYVFDCGAIGGAEIRLDSAELDEWRWVPVGELVIDRLARRVRHAYAAAVAGETRYLERGVLVGEASLD